MAVRGTITYIGFLDGTKSTPKRVLNKALRRANRLAVRSWFRSILPKHFKTAATARYGYADRTARYNRRKRKQYGHVRSLVLSGRMRRQVIRAERVTGGPKRATVTMSGPAYFYERPRKPRDMGKRPSRDATKPALLSQFAAEVTSVTRPELLALAKQHDRHVTEVLQKDRTRRTVRI